MDMNNPSSTSSEVTVFVETSLHTHLAVTASGNDTVSELKTILESEHQHLGRIKIRSLKINRNEFWYHLSDSIHVRRVVNGDSQEGFLFADALSLEKDTSEGYSVKDDSQSQPASKKKRKFEEVTSLEDSLKEKNRSERPSKKNRKSKKVTSLQDLSKENNILICGVVASKPEIASELLSVSVADSCPKIHSTNSSSRKKYRKKNKSPNPLNQVVDAAPARRGDTEGITIVASTRTNVEIQEGDDVAYTGRQGQQENHCTPPQVWQGHHEVPSSLDVDSVSNAGTVERKRGASAEKPDGHPSLGVKVPTQDGIGSAEKALEEAKPSQKIEAEAMPTEKHRIPEKGTRDGKDATSELLNTDETVTSGRNKNKKKKANDFNGNSLIKSGPEHMQGSEPDIPLAEPEEVVQAEKGSDKAREEGNDLSLKNGEDISEKETEGGTGSAEKALEETELSQKTDSEAMVIEKHEVPDKGKRDGNDATSKLLNIDASVTPSQKKNKRKKQKKTNDVNGDYLVKSGTEHIVGSETDISLAEPHEAVQAEKGSDKASEEDNDLSLKNGKDISEKETEVGTGSAEKALELSQKTDSEAMLIEKHKVLDKGKSGGNDVTSELLNIDGSVIPSKKKNKRKKQKKTNDVNGDYLVKSGTEHIVGSETDISLADPHEAVHAEKGSDKASEEDSNLPLIKEKVVLEQETESSPSVGTDLHKLQGNESKRKHGDDTTDLHKLQEEKSVSHQDPVLTIDSRTLAQTSRRKKSKLAKTIDQLNVKNPKEDSGVQLVPLRACSNSMSESTEVLSHAKQNTSVGRPLKPDQSGKLQEQFKFDVPDQIQKEVVSSGEVLAEEVATSKEADDNLMPSHSTHLQSPLKSHNYQRIGEKSEAGNSISVQQGGSISKNDSAMAQPVKMFPKEVAKTGAKAVSSDASGNINSTPKEAGKQSVTNASDANTPVGKSNEGLLNSDMKKSSNQVQSKTGKKHQSGVDRNVVASGKASGIGNGEVLNNPKNRKSSAALVGVDKNGSSKGRDQNVVSGITTSSEYSLSSESDYSDGDSNAGKKTSGKIGYSSIKSTPARRLKNDEIFLKSSIYKKAKLAVTLSQMEEDSQAVEFVPDSQPI